MGWFPSWSTGSRKKVAPSLPEEEEDGDERNNTKASHAGRSVTFADSTEVQELRRTESKESSAYYPSQQEYASQESEAAVEEEVYSQESEEEGSSFLIDSEIEESPHREEEPEDDLAALWNKLEASLVAMHPKLQDSRTLIPEEEMRRAVIARRNPAISDNARFVMGPPRLYQQEDWLGSREVPAMVCVTGFSGEGGNAGINGVYELYPARYHGRVVYQKLLEKRSVDDLLVCPPHGFVVDRPPALSPKTRVLAHSTQRALIIKAPRPTKGFETLWPVPNAWFLFFDAGSGSWCISSEVGRKEVYARCAGAEDLIPDNLHCWQVWDCGQNLWREHHGLRTARSGGQHQD